MSSATDALKRKFREGRQAEAIREAQAHLRRQPGDREVQQLCALMLALTRDFRRALALFRPLDDAAAPQAELLFNIGNCEKELGDFRAAAATFERVTAAFPQDAGGWAQLAECRFALGEVPAGSEAAQRALALDASLAAALAPPRVAQGDALQAAGRLAEAGALYGAALAMAPGDGPTLKKATLCLLEAGQAQEAVALCHRVLEREPANLTAKLGLEWLLAQQVPLWHVPMMNERERNAGFDAALRAVVTPEATVFEIGTGSGLLAMMAARAGARQVVTCEAVPLVAATARRIVERNGHADRVTVLAKPSQQVQLGADLPQRADVLVHEIFSSELLGEHVLPAIEDAKARLLKPGGTVLPACASLMVALVGGEALALNLSAGESSGFDLSPFNDIQPRKRPLHREDLAPELLSEPVEAFRFDFAGQAHFPAESKQLALAATRAGTCLGVIQWIRIEFSPGVVFENHPARPKKVSNWQNTVYAFAQPRALQPGDAVAVQAWHDRSRPWFEEAAG